jgi:ElaB/YqjD/DUF883 family membrane-anchored ribosome-binding protein
VVVDELRRNFLARRLFSPCSLLQNRDEAAIVSAMSLAIVTMRLGAPFFTLFVVPRRLVMFGQFGYSRAMPTNVGEMERRLRSIEQRLERAGGRASATAVRTADDVKDTIASVLSGIADRFGGNASLMSDGAAKIGSEAARLGNDALRRLSKEVEHRPLVTLGVAVGVGILVGLVAHRR